VSGLAVVIALGASALAQGRTTHAARHPGFSLTSKPWGTAAGQPVRLYTLSNGHMKVNITNFGGIIQSIDTPNRAGKLTDVTLGFSSLAGYEADDVYPQPSGGSGTTYFGATIGRYANRIANGQFTLDGVTYHLPINNGPNTLHGGTDSWNQQVWTPATSTSAKDVSLALTYTSPDGQDGFPGTVVATVTFSLGTSNALTIHYHATTDKPTVINMTNHSYFNLGGQASGSILGEKLMLNANTYTPTNATQIPTGAIDPVAGTPMDFRHAKTIGRDITDDFQPLTAYTDEPGVQLYTGNFLVGELVGTTGNLYRQSAGFTLETQHFPNSPNQPSFPSTTLNPGTPFNSTTVFSFGVAR
jgi:aldose 1-epimerase